jgi:hypothetical protein
MKNRSNNIYTGLAVGLISPPVAFFIFCVFEFQDESTLELLRGYAGRHVLSHVISLSVIINLPLFFAFLRSNRDNSARGVIGATLVYAFIILILKLT